MIHRCISGALPSITSLSLCFSLLKVISFELPEYKNSLDAETNLIALEGYVTALKLQNHKIKLECDVDLDYDPTK